MRSPTATRRNCSFDGFVRVFNNSGEEYEDAQVRLVVGTINLVEKIAQLAQVPMQQVKRLEKADRDGLRLRAAMMLMDAAAMPAGGAVAGRSQADHQGRA